MTKRWAHNQKKMVMAAIGTWELERRLGRKILDLEILKALTKTHPVWVFRRLRVRLLER